jgi:hypothetical protein
VEKIVIANRPEFYVLEFTETELICNNVNMLQNNFLNVLETSEESVVHSSCLQTIKKCISDEARNRFLSCVHKNVVTRPEIVAYWRMYVTFMYP